MLRTPNREQGSASAPASSRQHLGNLEATALQSVFVSYARSDGADFANALRLRLHEEAPDVQVWQDVVSLEGGVGWWRQIEEALDHVHILIMILTDGALKSEVTRREWRYARQQGVRIYPVMGPGFHPAGTNVPQWLRKAHCYNLESQWLTFLQHIRQAGRTTRVPFMAPDLPNGFVPRPAQSGQIKALLLGEKTRDPVANTITLNGAGGFGKTTLACSLCHDDDINLAFDDGILWVTLGEAPHLTDALCKIYAAITGERPSFKDSEDAAAALAEKLQHKTYLIVIDDVFDPVHLRPFMRGGSGCARLITTRLGEVAAEVGTIRVAVDEMSSEEAVKLLLAPREEQPTDFDTFARLARRLGMWPLLLRLVRSAIAQRVAWGDTLEGALRYVNVALDHGGVTAFDRQTTPDRLTAVAATVEASTKLLPESNRQQYLELAIFAEDELIPLCVLTDLWNCNEYEAERVATRLADASLVEFHPRTGTFVLHDVLRAYLRAELRPVGVQEVHRKLLRAWKDLYFLPYDYAWRRVGYHLAGAEQRDDLAKLLSDLRWLQSKLEATDVDSLLLEFDHANPERALVVVQDSVRLSAHLLNHTPSLLAQQLLSRIPESEGSIRKLLTDSARQIQSPWLRPLQPQLPSPGGALIRTFIGHKDWVRAVAISVDGSRAISASADNTLKLWDVSSGREVHEFTGHIGWVNAVAVSQDGKYAVSASSDGTLRLWDLLLGQEVYSFDGHKGVVNAVAISLDGRNILSGGADYTLRLWPFSGGSEVQTLTGHTDWVTAVAFGRDGRCAVSASDDGTVKLWDLLDGRELRTLVVGSRVRTLALSADDKWLLLAGPDGGLQMWDLQGSAQPRSVAQHAKLVTAVALSADGQRAVSASRDKTVKLWNLVTGKELRALDGHTGPVSAVALHTDGIHAISASHDGTLKLWNLARGCSVRSHESHTESVNAICLSATGELAISASSDCTLKLWNAKTGRQLKTMTGHNSPVTAVALDPAGQFAVSGGHDGIVKVWDISNGQELRTLTARPASITAIRISADSRRIILQDEHGGLRVWDNTARRAFLTINGDRYGKAVRAVSPNGDRALVSHPSRQLDVVDLIRRRRLRLLDRMPAWSGAVSISPNGTCAVSEDTWGAQVGLWELGSGRRLHNLIGHSSGTTRIEFTPDSTRAIVVGFDQSLSVFDVSSANQLCVLKGHTARINGLALSSNGRFLASVGEDRTLIVWSLESYERIAGFGSDSAISACALSACGLICVVGDSQGCVHFLSLENATGAAAPSPPGLSQADETIDAPRH